MKLAMVSGVMGASAPPAIASSASPERIIAAASAIASIPEGHAEETVTAFAQAPSRSAMALAAACGIEAAAEVVGARFGLPPWTASEIAFNYIECTRAYADYDRRGTREFKIVDVQTRVLQRHHRGGVGELGVARHALRFQLRFDIIEGIEIFHFAGDPALEIAGVKKRDRADPAPGREERFPKRFEPDPVGGHDPHSGNNNSISLIHGLMGNRIEGIRQPESNCILSITLNAVIMFLAGLVIMLFTKFPSYSQDAFLCGGGKSFTIRSNLQSPADGSFS